MAETFTTKADWLPLACKAKAGDVIRIHPRDGLTTKQVAEALAAQKKLFTKPGEPDWWIIDHGTSMLLQRKYPTISRETVEEFKAAEPRE